MDLLSLFYKITIILNQISRVQGTEWIISSNPLHLGLPMFTYLYRVLHPKLWLYMIMQNNKIARHTLGLVFLILLYQYTSCLTHSEGLVHWVATLSTRLEHSDSLPVSNSFLLIVMF